MKAEKDYISILNEVGEELGMEISPFFIIPNSIVSNRGLSVESKLFYAAISATCDSSGFSFASNPILAKLSQVDVENVPTYLNELVVGGFIKLSIGEPRKIRI